MKIGLTYTISPHVQNISKHENYLHWLNLSSPDEIIVFKPSDNNAKRIEECDALVLSGGVDIHPRFYNDQNLGYDNAPKPFQETRDQFEIDLFKIAIQKNLPVLGICRGLQLINIADGGSLYQDLGNNLNQVHKGNKTDKEHTVNIKSDTILHSIVKGETGLINSAHHQSINKLGDGLLINARADNGTIEGVEWKDKTGKNFLLAVQWHPERMGDKSSSLSKNIRDRFIEEINRSIQTRQTQSS